MILGRRDPNNYREALLGFYAGWRASVESREIAVARDPSAENLALLDEYTRAMLEMEEHLAAHDGRKHRVDVDALVYAALGVAGPCKLGA